MYAFLRACCCYRPRAPSEQSILAELESLDKGLQLADQQVHENELARQQLNQELDGLEAAIALARTRQAETYAHFQKRVRALARLPSGARLALLGGAGSLSDYLRSARLLRWVASHDRRLHAHYVAESLRLTALEEQRASRRAAMDTLVAQSRERREVLTQQRQQRATLLKSVRDESAKAQALAQERRAAQEKLRVMVAKIQPPVGPPGPPRRRQGSMGTMAPTSLVTPESSRGTHGFDRERLEPPSGLQRSFAQNRGRLPWPAAGAIRIAFGQRVELAFGTVTSHNGLDIGAPAGARVQAIAAGQVVYANWLRGYGQMIIIDHGEQYHSVVAHLASVDVQVGDTVTPGQALGTVGNTGSLRGTILYFEIRYKGTPVDPRPWLRR